MTNPKNSKRTKEEFIATLDSDVKNWEGDTVYFNGFTCAMGIGDIVLVLKNNNKNVAVINTSYTVAKTLVEKLNGLIMNLENKAKTKILTTDQVTNILIGKDND